MRDDLRGSAIWLGAYGRGLGLGLALAGLDVLALIAIGVGLAATVWAVWE